ILSLVQDSGILLADNRKFLFALYDDGTVIHATPESTWTRDRYHASTPGYVRAKLTPEEMAMLLRRLRPEELQNAPKTFDHSCDWPVKRVPRESHARDAAADGGDFVGEIVGGTMSCWTDSAGFDLTWRDGAQTTRISLIGGLDGGPSDDRSEVPAA